MIAALAAIAAGCGDRGKPPPVAAPAPDASSRVVASARVDATVVQATAAARCEECHGRITVGWKASTHAGARSARYLNMIQAGAKQTDCVRCHEPLVGRVAADEPVAEENVTCDVCHLVADVKPSRAGTPLAMASNGDTKLGPLCDLKDHYFHKVACSPLHEESTFCGGCHLWYSTTSGGELPIYTEYEEWQKSPAADSGMACQSCHMPSEREEVARGTGAARTVHHHGFAWRETLRERALELELKPDGDGVAITVKNVGAGHSVPSGAPEHRLAVRVRALDAAGATVNEEEHVLGRILVDASGAEAPFFRAVKLKEDTRIAPGQSYRVRYAVPTGAATVSVEALWREMPATMATSLGGRAPTELRMAERRIAWKKGRAK